MRFSMILVPRAVDVHGPTRHPVLQTRLQLCRALGAVAAQEGPVAEHGRAAARTDARNRRHLGIGRTQIHDRSDDLGDDISGLVDDDGVANAHVLAGELVVVVQRCARDDRTVHRRGIELRHGVSTPVRPTCTATLRRMVVFSSGGNLKAMAQRGALAVKPSSAWMAKSSTFTTTPSMS